MNWHVLCIVFLQRLKNVLMITSVNKEEKKKKKKYYKEEVRREEFYHHDNNGNDAANSINCKVSQEVRCFRFFFSSLANFARICWPCGNSNGGSRIEHFAVGQNEYQVFFEHMRSKSTYRIRKIISIHFCPTILKI